MSEEQIIELLAEMCDMPADDPRAARVDRYLDYLTEGAG
jgi:hypothetical protein